eukprot:s950_g19.t1
MQGQDPEAQNAVSILQEYIQSCSDFPPHSRILMWNFEKRLQEDSLLQFRATVSFVFKQVPHFFCGSWQTSKKKAQRDTAERVRRYMMKQGENIPEVDAGIRPQGDSALVLEDAVREELFSLREHSPSRCRTHVKTEVEERLAQNIKEFRMILLLCINSVPHHFAGAWCTSVPAATSDACDRVLWYFGVGESSAFHGSLNTAGRAAEQSPPHQLVQSKAEELDDCSPGGASLAERPPVEEKTILMQVQNTLQKTFSKDLILKATCLRNKTQEPRNFIAINLIDTQPTPKMENSKYAVCKGRKCVTLHTFLVRRGRQDSTSKLEAFARL